MKNFMIIYALLMISIFSNFIYSNDILNQTNKFPSNILDFYLNLPNEPLLGDVGTDIQNRIDYLTNNNNHDSYSPIIIDIKNGFISMRSEINHNYFILNEYALFTTKNLKYIACVFRMNDAEFPGYIISNTFIIYQFTNNNFIDVTKAVFPRIEYSMFFDDFDMKGKYLSNIPNDKIFYKLPRFGTKIEANIEISELTTQRNYDWSELYLAFKTNKINIDFNSKSGEFYIVKSKEQKYFKNNDEIALYSCKNYVNIIKPIEEIISSTSNFNFHNKLPVNNVYEAYFSKSVYVRIEIEPFDSKNKVYTNDHDYKDFVNGERIFGCNLDKPFHEFKSADLFYDNKKFTIPTKNLYNPFSINGKNCIKFLKIKDDFYILGDFSDGAGAYSILWKLYENKISIIKIFNLYGDLF